MDNYFSINVSSLFAQYSIKEIEVLNRKIQNEVDKKREELRTMVGERYRDLIQAADAITEMKFTCEKIENVINKNETVSWKKNIQQNAKVKNINEETFNFAGQIKILMNLIESISTLMDEYNFLEATQLFLISRHINASLKLNSHSDEMIEKFPVAMKMWDLISPFYNNIRTNCLNALAEENNDLDKTVNCLGSLILLENGQYNSSLDLYLQIREKTLQKILTDERNECVKDRLVRSVVELITTTKIVYETFISYNENEGLIIQKFKTLNSENLFSGLVVKSPFLINTNLLNRFIFKNDLNSLNKEEMKNSTAKWLISIEKIIQDKLQHVIKHIVSVDLIREIEHQIIDIQKPAHWKDVCFTLFNVDSLEFYDKFYQHFMLERMYKIINISWDHIQCSFKGEIEKLLILINDRVHRDMHYYAWMNEHMDNPQSLRDALHMEPKSHNLLMKVMGYSKPIVEICSELDLNLKKLIDDLKQYVQTKNSLNRKKKVTDGCKPNEKLLNYLNDSSKKSVSSLISYVKSTVLMNDVENCHLLARLLQAISEMCPNLKKCFSKNLLVDQTVYFQGLIFEDSEQWKEISQLLKSESIQLWRMWLKGFMNQWNTLKTEGALNSYSLLREFPTWKSLTINEKGENDQDIKSEISIPQQLSIVTHCWIFNIISSMNKMIPHTFPKQIHLEIVKEFNKKLYHYYRSLCQHKEIISNQKIAWQILFDLKILVGLFTLRDNKSEINNYQELVNECKLAIDPFDFDVFYPYVLNNIKNNISRLQHELGLLIPYSNCSLLQTQNILLVHDVEPNIVLLSASQIEKSWIPLLPIIKIKKTSAAQTGQEKLKQTQVKKTSMSTSSSNSALSSLQEWFK